MRKDYFLLKELFVYSALIFISLSGCISSTPEKRIAKLSAEGDMSALKRAALTDESAKVRYEIVKCCIIDQQLLAKIAIEDSSTDVRSVAVSKITNDNLLLKIIFYKDMRISSLFTAASAVNRLSKRESLMKVFLEHEDKNFALTALENINDPQLIEKFIFTGDKSKTLMKYFVAEYFYFKTKKWENTITSYNHLFKDLKGLDRGLIEDEVFYRAVNQLGDAYFFRGEYKLAYQTYSLLGIGYLGAIFKAKLKSTYNLDEYFAFANVLKLKINMAELLLSKLNEKV